jgi:hypothetical protein
MTTTVVTAAAPHPVWYARAGTWFLAIGRAIKSGIAKAVGAEPKIQAAITQIAPTLEGVSEMLLPGSAQFEAHLLDVWGVVANGVKDAGAAATANGLNLTLDQTIINDVKKFLPAVEAYLHPAANAAAPPALVKPAPVPVAVPSK